MKQHIAQVALVVPDYDEAIAFYVGKLGFELLEDSEVPEQGKRWVVVAPPGGGQCSLLLARASNAVQASRIGNQTGGRVFLFLHTDDVVRDHQRYLARGVQFVRPMVEQPYGTVAVFSDPWGNLWDLIQPRSAAAGAAPTQALPVLARNIEIKARVDSLAALEARVKPLANEGPVPLTQDDSFFHCAQGRLKLREFADGTGELIFYQRADTDGPKASFHVRSPTADPAGLRDALARAHGLLGRVTKTRTLYLVGRTRVHLDRVSGLGDFMELEVVLTDGEAESAGIDEAERLMRQLGIRPADCVVGAYLDLLPSTRQGTLAREPLPFRTPATHLPTAMRIELDDLSRPAIHRLLEEHLANMHALSPPESVHALDLSRLKGPEISFWSIWEGDTLMGCAALKDLGGGEGEIKSMRTPQALRGRGAGRALLCHLLDQARSRGWHRLWLETGSQAAFEPARRLYASAGFLECGPFADYAEDPNSVFMSLDLAPGR